MVNQPFLKHLLAALPADVALSPGQEAGDGMAPQVVDEAVLAQLPHQRINPWKAGATPLPSLKPSLRLLVLVHPNALTCFIVLIAQRPVDLPAVIVALHLLIVLPPGLRTKVHLAKQQLAFEIGREGACRSFELLDHFLDSPIELADAEAAKVKMGR